MAMSLPSRSRDRRVLSEINVTPLADVMLVLLVIFMVTAPMLYRGTDVRLPQAQHSDVKAQDRLTLTLSKEGRIYLNNQEVPRAALRDRLVAAMQGRECTLQFPGGGRPGFVRAGHRDHGHAQGRRNRDRRYDHRALDPGDAPVTSRPPSRSR
jgi:biopolymer transport protein ExbD